MQWFELGIAVLIVSAISEVLDRLLCVFFKS